MSNGSRTKKTIKNIGVEFFNQILSLFLHFISRNIFIQVLGVEYLGINGLFSDILQMLSLADMGFGTAMVYSFYKPLAERDSRKIAALANYYRKMYMFIALGISTIGVLLVPFLDVFVNTEKEIPFLIVYYLLNVANTVRTYLFVYKTSLITADQKQYIISKYNAIWSTCSIIAQIIVLLLFKNYVMYLTVSVLMGLGNNIHVSRIADKMYPEIHERDAELNKEEKEGLFYNLRSMFIYKLSGVLLNATDNTLISVMIGTVWVGYYSNYEMVLYYLNLFIGIIFSSMTASIGNLVVEEGPEKRYQIFESLQVISYVMCGIAAPCLFFLMEDFITVWLGAEFILDRLLLVAIVVNFYLGAVLRPVWSYREATGLYVKIRYVMFCTAVLNIILSIVLGQWIGMAGIVFASALSRLLTYIWYEPYSLFRDSFNRSAVVFYRKILSNILASLAVCAVCGRFAYRIQANTWLELIGKAILIGCVSCLGMFLFYRKTMGFQILLEKGKQILGMGKEQV